MKWFGLLIVRSVRLLLDIPITGFDNNWLLSIKLRRKMLLNDPHYQLLFLCVVSRKTRTKELFVTNSGSFEDNSFRGRYETFFISSDWAK